MTKIKIALVAALLAGSASAALAQDFDPNLANRYPAYAGAGAGQTFQSAPVQLRQGRNAGVTNDRSSWGQSEIDVDRADRASSPYAGGGY
jgi:opacity protein-like surface antigen